jgi:CRP/FNR family cyclic AMP-dependent transcriptional regulator
MARTSKRDLLASLPLFRACSPKELKQIEALVDEASVEAGHGLTAQGDVGTQAFVVVSGEADVEVDGRVVATVGEGELIGEMSLLDRTSRRSATVTAKTAMELLVLDPRSFSTLLDAHPSVTRQIAVGLAERLRTYEASPVA